MPVLAAVLWLCSCAAVQNGGKDLGALSETLKLAADVRAFGRTKGIEPTAALSRTVEHGPAMSMLWLWLQRAGTLALRRPVDLRVAVGFFTAKEQLKLEQVYRVDGYSVYYRQGNEFADPRALTTPEFAEESAVHQVKVILHEDLHGDQNFDLSWEMEESIVTPLAALAAVEFFKRSGNDENWREALEAVGQERVVSRELNAFVKSIEGLFDARPIEQSKQQALALMRSYPNYQKRFQRQIKGQHPPTALEAKLSHDLAYYRYYDAIASLYEKIGLAALVEELKSLPGNADHEALERKLELLAQGTASPAQRWSD